MTEQTSKTDERTILIVEDDETSFLLLQVYLSQKNYKILYASNGKMAVDIFRQNKNIDLILMDLKMPILDGYKAAGEIRELDEKIPIIAQTAYALSGDSEKAINAGCTDYITKPIKKDLLLAKIENLLNKHSATR